MRRNLHKELAQYLEKHARETGERVRSIDIGWDIYDSHEINDLTIETRTFPYGDPAEGSPSPGGPK